jgi:hypothetical protein
MEVEGNSNKCYISNYVGVKMKHMVTWYYAFYGYTYIFRNEIHEKNSRIHLD